MPATSMREEPWRSEGDALQDLQQSYNTLSERVAALERQARRSFADLADRIAGCERCKTTLAQQGEALRSIETAARIQQITAAVNAAQTAAYGRSGSIGATDNVLLAGNQLFWVLIEPLLRRLGVDLGPSPSVLTWLAPVGTLVTGAALMGGRQHVRFISGIATFDGTSLIVTESLRSRIAPNLRREFERRTDIPATATAVDPMGDARIRAQVRQGTLVISADVPLDPDGGSTAPKGRVAWLVDTGADGE